MSFTKNLNNLLLLGAVLIGTSIGGTSEVISHHFFQGSPSSSNCSSFFDQSGFIKRISSL